MTKTYQNSTAAND